MGYVVDQVVGFVEGGMFEILVDFEVLEIEVLDIEVLEDVGSILESVMNFVVGLFGEQIVICSVCVEWYLVFVNCFSICLIFNMQLYSIVSFLESVLLWRGDGFMYVVFYYLLDQL